MSRILFSPRYRSALIIVAYVVCMIVAAMVVKSYVDQDRLQTIVAGAGSLGIVVYFFVEVFYVVFTPLLNTVIFIASGYLFGGHLGLIINFFAITAGLFLIILLVKKYGRPLLQKVIPQHLYNRFDSLTQKIGPIALLIVYVLPFTPDDELTYIVAAGPISFKRFILPVVLGTLAKSAYSYIGDLGTRGIVVAFYARLVLLGVGLIVVGAQEYFMTQRN